MIRGHRKGFWGSGSRTLTGKWGMVLAIRTSSNDRPLLIQINATVKPSWVCQLTEPKNTETPEP